MIKKPQNYDEVEVNEFNYEPLKLGGHKCIIVDAEEYEGLTGNLSLKVCVDIAKGDPQEEFYKKQYDSNTDQDKKWPAGAIKYVSLKEDEKCVRMLKAFITAVENSNSNYKYDWGKDVKQLIGKKVGGNWGLEEYTDSKGEIKTATKLREFRSVDKVENLKIPKVKLINNTYVEFLDYEGNRGVSVNQAQTVEIKEEELPFDL